MLIKKFTKKIDKKHLQYVLYYNTLYIYKVTKFPSILYFNDNLCIIYIVEFQVSKVFLVNFFRKFLLRLYI